MRVAITGAGGFIGRALVETLLQEGIHDVVAVDTVVAPCPMLADTTWLVGDISDPGFVAHIFTQPCDALVHLATVSGGAAEESRALAQRINLNATLALLEAMRTKHTPPRVVFASSIAVYGDLADAVVSDETPSAPPHGLRRAEGNGRNLDCYANPARGNRRTVPAPTRYRRTTARPQG